nr:phage tail protein [uncultured Novosphingobium sp.]
MATLVLNAVGTAIGGPVGGAIGSMVGSQFDAAIFGSPHRQGPRLKELEVTSSSYGQPLPRHFGRMRVAGQVIWATDLVESSETLGGGKGAASITTYSYTVSFAVALSSRPIAALGRIWADGRLLRGTEGDLKAAGTLRLHLGHGDQPCDPLILSAEGEARSPAHRDLAYVVFEDLDLSEFYNRIPALTFEVLADEDFELADVLGDLVADADAAVPLEGFRGLTCDGPLDGVLQTIDQVLPLDVDAGPDTLVVSRRRSQDRPIALPEAAVSAGDDDFGGAAGFSRRRLAAEAQPISLLRYFDSERDYLPGVQHAQGPAGTSSTGAPRAIELPATLSADTARTMIEQVRQRIDWSRERISWRTSELDPEVAPGALVTFPGIAGQWRVLEWEWRDTGVELSAERLAPGRADNPEQSAADPGRLNAPQDLPAMPTVLAAFELPCDPATAGTGEARLFAALSSAGSNWSGAALFADRGDGALHPLGPSGRKRATMGRATDALPPISPLLFDRRSRLEVTLVDAAMQLVAATTRQLAEGANLAFLGEEMIQFARATSLGNGRWRLEGLLRGRGGTEGAVSGHVAGESFVLLDGSAVALDPALVGTAMNRRVVALGRGDAGPVTAPLQASGLTLRPLAPVHPRAAMLQDDTLRLEWTRRARGNWVWQDGIDVPLMEHAESYLVTVGPLAAPLASWTVSSSRLDIPPGTLAHLAALAPGEILRVRQQGTYALSDPLPLFRLP